MIKTAALTNWFPFGQGKTKIKVYGKSNGTAQVSVSNRVVLASRKQSSALHGLLHTENSRVLAAYGLAAGIVVMFVINLFSVNYNVATGYKINSVQKQIASLTEENKRLVLKMSEAGSIAPMQENFAAEHFVPVTNVEYVHSSPGSLVLK
jgi:hypothetical protein